MITIYILAFSGGIFLAVHAGFNAQLGALLKQPVAASAATSAFGLLFSLAFLFLSGKVFPEMEQMRQIPWYLWGIGGFFSVLGISLYFYTIPKLGIARMITLGLCGQLLFSLLATQMGWLNLPQETISLKRFAGAIVMIIGIFLINAK